MSHDPFSERTPEAPYPFGPTPAGFNQHMRHCGLAWRLVRHADRWALVDANTPVPFPVDSDDERLITLVAQVFVSGTLYGELMERRRQRGED